MRIRLLLWSFAIAVATLLPVLSYPVRADHNNNGPSGKLYAPVDQYDMNSPTVNRQTTYLRLITYNSGWSLNLSYAVSGWNSGISSISGFNVFTFDNAATPFVEVKAAISSNEANDCPNDNSHGCVLFWPGPSARIYMYGPYMTQTYHGRSDLMHEMGHVLMHANEHYEGFGGYNCTSIMGHSSIENEGSVGHCNTGVGSDVLVTIQNHDRTDYLDIYGVEDAPNATYVQMSGSGTLVHYFEGGYFGGNGKTLHQELYNWIDRSTSGVSGSYSSYQSPGRKVDDQDDTTPESDSYNAVPGSGNEWCFKRRGRAGGIGSSQPNYWGPFSKAYCIRQSYGGSGVFVASNRNDYVGFRVWNHSGAQINNVALLLDNGVTHVCDLPNLANGASAACLSSPSTGTGFVRLWYNWTEHGPIGYDAR